MITAWILASAASATDSSFGLGVAGTYDFGIAVVGGDFDGDGLSDLAAAGRTLASGFEEPIVHVYDGAVTSPGTSTSPSVSLGFENVFWEPALGAADVNGDGYDDLLVGIGRSFVQCCGYVDVFLGSSAGLPPTRSGRLAGAAANDYFGTSVSTAGDVNGDGYDDVVIGALYGDDPNGVSTGSAHLFLGSASGLSAQPLRSWYGNREFDHLGEFVSGGGDVDGDGYDDVLVSVPDAKDGRGQMRLYTGSPTGPGDEPSAILFGTNETSRLLGSIVGDTDGDGYADLVVRFQDASGPGGILFGRGTADGPVIDRALEFPDPTGAVPEPAGDVNGDGFADLLVSSRWVDVAQIWLGGPDGPEPIAARALGGSAGEEWGWSARGIGDTDGDGYDEVAVGGPLDGDGTVVVLGGHPDLVTVAPDEADWGDPIAVDVESAFGSTEITLAASTNDVRKGRCLESLARLCTGLEEPTLVDTQTGDASGVASFSVDPPRGVYPGDTAWFVGVSVMADGDWIAVERSAPVPVEITAPGTTN